MGKQHRGAACFLLPAARAFRPACWQPPADVYRTRQGWLVKLDLAGVRPDEVQLQVSGRTLIVRGARRDIHVEEGCHHHSLEISYSQFERHIELPVSLEEGAISVEYDAGMLLVRIRTEGGGKNE